MATAVARGMRAMASKKKRVSPALTTPRSAAPPRSRRGMAQGRGRAMAAKISAAQHSRSQVVPAGPTWAKTGVDAAAPICTVKTEARARRMPLEDRARFGTRSFLATEWPQRRPEWPGAGYFRPWPKRKPTPMPTHDCFGAVPFCQ